VYFSKRLRNLVFMEVFVAASSAALASLSAIFLQITDPRKKRGVRASVEWTPNKLFATEPFGDCWCDCGGHR